MGKIRQIAVSVADLEVSKQFYRDTVGLKLLFEAPPGLAFFDCSGTWLMLSAATEAEPAQPGSALYFESNDIEADYALLEAAGAKFVDKPHMIANMGTYELWMTFFKDPDGTLLALRSEKSMS